LIVRRRRRPILARRRHALAFFAQHAAHEARTAIVDELVETIRPIAQEIPVASVLGIRVRDAHARRRETLERNFVEIAEKSAPETLLLPQRKAREREHAERRERDEEPMPESKLHARMRRPGTPR